MAVIQEEATTPELSNKVGAILDMFQRARDARRARLSTWRRSYNIVMNRAWAPDRAAWMPSPQVAEMHPILAALVGWQIDTQPTFDVVPQADPNSPFYDLMADLAGDLRLCLRSAWVNEDFDRELQAMLWDAWVYGAGITKAVWDPRASGGLGNVKLVRVDPFSFYPDPKASCISEADYLIEYHDLSQDELESRFPGASRDLRDTGTPADKSPVLNDEIGESLSENLGNLGVGTSTWAERSYRDAPKPDVRYHLLECWYRTSSSERGKSFDQWRCVVLCGNTVLMDEPAENLWAHRQHPYERYVPIELGEFWPVSMAELLAPCQRSINRLLAAVEHNIWLAGNPVFVEDQRAGTQRQRVTNRPGTRITKAAGSEVRWMDPPQIHPQMAIELISFYVHEMERISGLSAIVRGATPTGRNAQSVIDSVQEAAFVRIRTSLHNLEIHLRNQGEKLASNVCEFYDTPRIVSLIGPSGEQTSKMLRTEHFYVPDPSGKMTPLKFQLLVQAGSNVATSKAQRVAQAESLFAVGAIDAEALLSTIDFPNWQNVVARVRETQAANGTLGLPPTQRAAARR